MSEEQYWERDPYLVLAFQKAYLLSVERRNQELWLQGLYIHNAFGVVLSNAFAKKGAKEKKYISEPIRITPMSERERKDKEARERQKIITSLTAWGKSWNETK